MATMTTPIRADIAEKENAPSPAVKPSPKPADIARGDDDKFVGLDGKVKHRKVVKADGTTVDASTGHAAAPRGGEQEPMNDYERQREERIRRNNEQLRALKVLDTAKALEHSADAASNANVVKRTKSKGPSSSNKAPAPPPRAKSRRLAVLHNADAALAAKLQAAENTGDFLALDDEGIGAPAHLTCEEWCEQRLKKTPGPKMDGHFRGWVEPNLVKSLGLASSAGEAWEAHGGGSFAKAGKAGKGENAKEFARKMIRKNPNCYFYRHNAPGEDAWHGDWAQDEIERFVTVANEHGCGDKWGLFASYIPHRVGYQCSAAYRHVIIPRGLLLDDQFVMSGSGEAVYVGKKGSKRQDD